LEKRRFQNHTSSQSRVSVKCQGRARPPERGAVIKSMRTKAYATKRVGEKGLGIEWKR